MVNPAVPASFWTTSITLNHFILYIDPFYDACYVYDPPPLFPFWVLCWPFSCSLRAVPVNLWVVRVVPVQLRFFVYVLPDGQNGQKTVQKIMPDQSNTLQLIWTETYAKNCR